MVGFFMVDKTGGVALSATKFVQQYGEKAEALAEAQMLNEMRLGDVAKAADWMAILYEIRHMRGRLGTIH